VLAVALILYSGKTANDLDADYGIREAVMDTDTAALLEKVEVKGYNRNCTTLRQLLKQLRTSKFRAPKVVVTHGSTLINSFASSLGDEREY
jgi:hypothetical protein